MMFIALKRMRRPNLGDVTQMVPSTKNEVTAILPPPTLVVVVAADWAWSYACTHRYLTMLEKKRTTSLINTAAASLCLKGISRWPLTRGSLSTAAHRGRSSRWTTNTFCHALLNWETSRLLGDVRESPWRMRQLQLKGHFGHIFLRLLMLSQVLSSDQSHDLPQTAIISLLLLRFCAIHSKLGLRVKATAAATLQTLRVWEVRVEFLFWSTSKSGLWGVIDVHGILVEDDCKGSLLFLRPHTHLSSSLKRNHGLDLLRDIPQIVDLPSLLELILISL